MGDGGPSTPKVQNLLVHCIIVTAAHNWGIRKNLVDFCEFCFSQLYVRGRKVLEVALRVPE